MTRENGTLFYRWVMVRVVFLLLVIGVADGIEAHILDELSVKTRIEVKPEIIELNLAIAPGVLITEPFLEILDPDKTAQITEKGKNDFLTHVKSHLIVRLNQEKRPPHCSDIRTSSFSELATGVGTIYIDCKVNAEVSAREGYSFSYQNTFENRIALYSLHIDGDIEQGIRIFNENRDEITQEEVVFEVGISTATPTEPGDAIVVQNRVSVAPAVSRSADAGLLWEFLDIRHIIDRLKAGQFSGKATLLLMFLAAAAGFLHAFTPGHGKALVGAYLIANRGSMLQAVQLGLVVTLTHTISIYCLGALSLIAVYFFLPSRIVPILSVVSGVLIIGMGLFGFVRRILKLDSDHAHLLPNLSIFQGSNVNILLDGNSAESTEYLSLAAGGERVQNSLKAVGAEDIVICSTGCDGHRKRRLKYLDERFSSEQMKRVIRTRAVDAVVSGASHKIKRIEPLLRQFGGVTCSPPCRAEEAEKLLLKVIQCFRTERSVVLPRSRMNWRDLVYFGFAGGIIPCPDALAILMIAISMAQVLAGLAVVFSFSAGLSTALILTGLIILGTKKLMLKSSLAGELAGYVPYITSAFLIGLGIYIVAKAV